MRRLPAFGIALVFLAVLAVHPAVAVADPITVTDGSLTVGGTSLPTLSLSALGFSVAGHDRAVDSFPLAPAGNGQFSLNGTLKEDFDTSHATVNGVDLGNVWVDGSFKITGGNVSRAGDDDMPFQLTGTLTAFRWDGSGPSRGELLFTQTITAQGVADVDFSSHGSPAVVFNFSSVSRELSGESRGTSGGQLGSAASVVTPEPASLLLLGSGLALAAVRARGKTRTARRRQ